MDQFDALLVMKGITDPHLSPSRAVVLVRERAKRRQGCMRAGLLSNEKLMIRSAEVVSTAEGKTARTASVRSGRAPRCRRTQARMYVQSRDLGGLSVTTVPSAAVAKVKAVAKRRMHGGEESDSGIVLRKPANKARGAAWRSRWREGPGATGERSRQSTDRTQSREMRWGPRARQRAVRVTGACAPRQFQRGAVTTGARSRMR